MATCLRVSEVYCREFLLLTHVYDVFKNFAIGMSVGIGTFAISAVGAIKIKVNIRVNLARKNIFEYSLRPSSQPRSMERASVLFCPYCCLVQWCPPTRVLVVIVNTISGKY